jgi:putative N6-adenine-specific DNA methylase
LVPLINFKAENEDILYEKVKRVDWSSYIRLDQTFAIDNTVNSSIFRHSKYVALKTKDAIADQFKETRGKRPDVDIQNPDIQLDVYCAEDQFIISLDSSGDTLNRRGYRTLGHAAPLNEVLAAGLVMLSGWDASKPLVDPMCGTGTILIEAAMIGLNMAPQLNRSAFAFMNWANFDKTLWEALREEARGMVTNQQLQLFGSDIDKRVIAETLRTVIELELDRQIVLEQSSFERLIHDYKDGFVIMNPPYGERLESADINAFYKRISDALKQNFQGFNAWVLSSNMVALKHLRLKPSKKIVLFNGPLECRFQQYELYQGTKRT